MHSYFTDILKQVLIGFSVSILHLWEKDSNWPNLGQLETTHKVTSYGTNMAVTPPCQWRDRAILKEDNYFNTF